MKTLGVMMPLAILCCLMTVFIVANIEGTQVSWMTFALNGAGIVLALIHSLEFRI